MYHHYLVFTHAKDPIPDAQKTDIIYHWKCPANNCTVEYIDETNRSLKERVLDHRNQTTSAIRNHHISTNHPKAELKDFIIIDRERATPYTVEQKKHFTFISKIYHSTEKLAKSESLQYSTNFSKLPDNYNFHTVLSPHPRGHQLHLVFQHKRQLTLHTFLISIYNRNVIPMYTYFKLNLYVSTFMETHRETIFTHQKVSSSPESI